MQFYRSLLFSVKIFDSDGNKFIYLFTWRLGANIFFTTVEEEFIYFTNFKEEFIYLKILPSPPLPWISNGRPLTRPKLGWEQFRSIRINKTNYIIKICCKKLLHGSWILKCSDRYGVPTFDNIHQSEYWPTSWLLKSWNSCSQDAASQGRLNCSWHRECVNRTFFCYYYFFLL